MNKAKAKRTLSRRKKRQAGSEGWEETKHDWIVMDTDRLKKEGFRVQATARFLIHRLGYDVLKAEEDYFSQEGMLLLERKVGRHLARHSDYIAAKGNHLFVIDVKAKHVGYVVVGKVKHSSFNQSIFLSSDYVDTIVPFWFWRSSTPEKSSPLYIPERRRSTIAYWA